MIYAFDQSFTNSITVLEAAAICSKDAHSLLEWKLCPPVKTFGVGIPISVKREPSVPPRIGEKPG